MSTSYVVFHASFFVALIIIFLISAASEYSEAAEKNGSSPGVIPYSKYAVRYEAYAICIAVLALSIKANQFLGLFGISSAVPGMLVMITVFFGIVVLFRLSTKFIARKIPNLHRTRIFS